MHLHSALGQRLGIATLLALIALVGGRIVPSFYGLITLAALLRVAAPLSGEWMVWLTSLAGVAWSAAFALFVVPLRADAASLALGQ